MKNLRLYAAIAVAAMMVACVGAVAISTSYSTATDPPGMEVDDININALMALPEYEKVPSTAVAVPDGLDVFAATGNTSMVLFLQDDYTWTEGSTFTIESGQALAYCPLQPFSLNSEGVSFIFEDGAYILIVSDFTYENPWLQSNIIYQYEFEEDETEFVLSGTFKNVVGTGLDCALTLTAGTTVNDGFMTYGFPTENKIGFKATGYDFANNNVNMALDIVIDATVESQIQPGYLMTGTIKGTPSYAVVGKVEGNDLKWSVTGDGDITYVANLKEGSAAAKQIGTVKYSNELDFNLTIQNYSNDQTRQGFFDGNMKVKVDVDDVDMDVTNDKNVVIANYRLSDTYGEFDIDFDDTEFSVFGKVNIGSMVVTDTVNDLVMTEVKGASADIEFSAEVDMTSDIQSVLSIGTKLPRLDSLAASESTADKYIKGAAQNPDMEIHEYAADFFFDQYMPNSDGLKNRYLEANVNLDRLYMRNGADYKSYSAGSIEVEGAYVNFEVSNSVGMSMKAGVGKVIVSDVPYTLGSSSTVKAKLMVEPASISINTSDDRTVYLEEEFNITGEVKVYDEDTGMLMTDIYANGVHVKALEKSDTELDSLSIKSVGYGNYGVFYEASGIDYDKEAKNISLSKISIVGDYYEPKTRVLRVDGSLNDVVIPMSSGTAALAALSSSVTDNAKVGSVTMRVYDLNNNYVQYDRTYNSSTNQILNEFEFDGFVYYDDVMGFIEPFTDMPVGDSSKDSAEIYRVSGYGVLNSEGYTPEVGPAVITTCATITSGKVGFEWTDSPVAFTGGLFVANNPLSGVQSRVVVDGRTFNVDMTGAALGIAVDDKGKTTYTLVALPGYEIDKTVTPTGFTIGDGDEESAAITIDSGDTVTLAYTAKAKTYKIYVDGDYKAEGKFGEKVEFATDATFLFTPNGAIIGNISDGKWSLIRNAYATGTDDLELTSVKITEYTDLKYDADNTPTTNAITFTVPAAGAYKTSSFVMPSKVRFEIGGQSSGTSISLIAEETSFNGKSGYIIKADKNGAPLSTKLYLPVSGEGQRIMHVDEYGRVSELQSVYTVIDGQGYQYATVGDYSIFYLEDDSPNYDTGGNGKNNNLLYIGIAVVVAVVALAGVAYFLKTKQSA